MADNIIACRARRRLSQRSLAERMTALGFEWRQQTVASIESGGRRVFVGELLGLACALSTSFASLLEAPPDVPRSALPSGEVVDAFPAARPGQAGA